MGYSGYCICRVFGGITHNRLILDSGRSLGLGLGGGDGVQASVQTASSNSSSLRNKGRGQNFVGFFGHTVENTQTEKWKQLRLVIGQLLLQHENLSLEFVLLL